MAPISDERREVAARLRDDDHGYETEYDFLVQALGMPRKNHGQCDWSKVHERLADLIDPCPSMADEQMGKLRRRSTALASMTRIASDMSGWAGELADSCEHHDARGRWLLCNLQLYFEVKPDGFCAWGEKVAGGLK